MASRCLSYLDFLRDVSREVLLIQLAPVISYLLDVLPTNLPSLPPMHYIDFLIQLQSITPLISILPY